MQQASSCRAGSPLVLWKAVIAHAFFWRLRGYGAKAFARRCHWGNRLCLFLAVSTRFHLQRAHLIKIALIGNFAFLWTLSLLNTSSALPVVFVSLSTAINNRASLTVFGKTPSPPRGGMWLEALSHLWRGNPVAAGPLPRNRTIAGLYINIESQQTSSTQGEASKRSRNEPTPQTRRQAKHQPRAKKKTVIVNLTSRIKHGLLCPFPAARITEHQNSLRRGSSHQTSVAHCSQPPPTMFLPQPPAPRTHLPLLCKSCA